MKTLFDHLCLQRVMVVVQEPRDNEIRGVVPSFQVRSPALTSDVCLLKVGDLVNVTCYSRGSSPPAQLQWSVNGERVSKAELLMDILSVHTEDSAQFTFSTFRSSLTHAALQQIYFNGHFRRREGQIGRVHKDFETIFYSQILWSNHLGSS